MVTALLRGTVRPNTQSFCAKWHIGDHEKRISLHKNLMTNIHEKLQGNVEFPRRFQQDFSASVEKPLHNAIRINPASINRSQLRMFVYGRPSLSRG